jgi:hypothetical protein
MPRSSIVTISYNGAREALRATARRIRGYAGQDAELHRIMRELMEEAERFHQVMPERLRKVHFAASSHALRSRDFEGKARRVTG